MILYEHAAASLWLATWRQRIPGPVRHATAYWNRGSNIGSPVGVGDWWTHRRVTILWSHKTGRFPLIWMYLARVMWPVR